MENNDMRQGVASGVIILASIWLVVSSFFFDVSGSTFWAQLVAGIVLFVLGIYDMIATDRTAAWLSGIVGLWLLVAPLAFSMSAATTWNHVIVGLAVIGLAVMEGMAIGRPRQLAG